MLPVDSSILLLLFLFQIKILVQFTLLKEMVCQILVSSVSSLSLYFVLIFTVFASVSVSLIEHYILCWSLLCFSFPSLPFVSLVPVFVLGRPSFVLSPTKNRRLRLITIRSGSGIT